MIVKKSMNIIFSIESTFFDRKLDIISTENGFPQKIVEKKENTISGEFSL